MMRLNSFSTLFEIAATLNLAYIAVDYSTAFTISVAKNVFHFHDKIAEGLAKCKKHIDEATINSINDVNLNGHSISHKIEKVKIDSSKLKKELKLLRNELTGIVEERCKLTCFSSICLHLFLYCIVACVVMGYADSPISHTYWFIFVIFSIIYTSLMFYMGEIKGKFVNFYQSIKCNSISFALLCVFAGLVSIIFVDYLQLFVNYIWDAIVPLTALYPLVFFIFFILLLKKNSKTIYTDIEVKINAVEAKCITLETEVSKLVSTHELSIEVEGLPKETIETKKQTSTFRKGKKKQRQSSKPI